MFIARLLKLLPVLIPGPFCKETFYLALVAALMILRTLCDIWQVRLFLFLYFFKYFFAYFALVAARMIDPAHSL